MTETQERSAKEEALDLIAATITNISGTNITTTSEVIDVLLDIANLINKQGDN